MKIHCKHVFLSLVFAGLSYAAPQLATPFTDNAVLQRDAAVPVWGTAAPGETVRVSFGGQTKTAVADADGNWRVVLDPMSARTAGELTVEGDGAAKQTISNVITGEVWFVGGQSNATLPLRQADPDAKAEIAQADYPEIREFRSEIAVCETPQTAGRGAWRVCTPQTAGDFSGMGYFFAKQIARDLNVPVGILNCNKGGAPVFSMISDARLRSQPKISGFIDRSVAKASALWAERHANGGAVHTEPGENPMNPFGTKGFHRRAVLFNGMVNPLIPYAIRGVLWNQGEADMTATHCYFELLKMLVEDWRARWGSGDLPFYIVQLANISNKSSYEPTGKRWPLIREAQAQARAIPNVWTAVSCDIGDMSDVPPAARHPKNKRELGRRLAMLAEAHTYGKDIFADSPFFKDARVDGGAIVCTFDNATGLKTSDGGAPNGFEIAGDDGKFYPAEADIKGETIVLRSASTPAPAVARYAWNNPCAGANVVNGAGLPLSPFRTKAQ